jgi:CRP-like cAMP-binding protein
MTTVSTPARKPTTAEQGVLLNQAVLLLSPDVKMAKLSSERLALKYQPGRRYLIVTPQQWNTLQEFKNPNNVTTVLCGLIGSERNPSLRELYELAIKAAQAGVLQTVAWPSPVPEKPVNWPLRLKGAVMPWLAGLGMIAAVASMILRPVRLPAEAWWLLLGWLAAGVAGSLGTILAASVVRAAGGDVYQLRFRWKTLVPRLDAKLSDALMGGRVLETHVALARLAPYFILLAVVAWWAPDLMLPVLGGTLFALSPFWRTPLLDLLESRYREPQLATTHDVVLARDRLYQLLTLARQHLADRNFHLAGLFAALAWLTLVFLTGATLLRIGPAWSMEKLQAVGGKELVERIIFIAGGVLVAGVVGFIAWVILSRLRVWWRARTERKLRPAAVLMSPETIAGWLGRSILFRELPATDLAAVAAAVKPEQHKRGSTVVREGEPGEKLYIVLSGRLEVRRDYAPGKSEPVAEMEEGDVFGEIALLQGGPRTRSVRSLGSSVLLGLDKADFERLVMTKLSRQAVTDAVQKVGFLQHAKLTRNWSHATMASFARRSKMLELAEKTMILEQGKANHHFFLVQRGELSVRVKGEEVRRLKSGDSFGELSLLGNGLATADVVVASKLASVLEIPARDFLEFISQDFLIGLDWEDTRAVRREAKKKK